MNTIEEEAYVVLDKQREQELELFSQIAEELHKIRKALERIEYHGIQTRTHSVL